MIDVTFTFS